MRRSTEAWPGSGERIRKRLQDFGVTVEEFCRAHHYHLGLFYKWMGERVAPRRENVIRLARDLDLPIRWLLFGDATYVDGVPVDVLVAGLPADLQPETLEEKRRFFTAAFDQPKPTRTRRKPVPIAGGSTNDGTKGVDAAIDVLRLIGRWLRAGLYRWGLSSIRTPRLACA